MFAYVSTKVVLCMVAVFRGYRFKFIFDIKIAIGLYTIYISKLNKYTSNS